MNGIQKGLEKGEPMNDLISRKELLKRTIYNPCHAPYIVEQDVIECPTAEPKVGRWKRLRLGIDNYTYCGECSNCKCKVMYGTYKPFDYCPNCGARMEGELNELNTERD